MIWIAASIAFIFLWMRVFKAYINRARVGRSTGQFAGQIGMVTREIKPLQ